MRQSGSFRVWKAAAMVSYCKLYLSCLANRFNNNFKIPSSWKRSDHISINCLSCLLLVLSSDMQSAGVHWHDSRHPC